MKVVQLVVASIVLLMVCAISPLQAQDKKETKQVMKTEEIKVGGSCNMCKDRIEKAAKIDGVSEAKWTKSTQMLKVTYNPQKVTMSDVEKKVAAVGHDTPNVKADDKVYNALPSCCHYRK